MRRFRTLLLAAAAAAFCACSDDNGGDGGKDIQLAPGTPKDYTIFADETSGTPSEGISFSTTGPWRATVAETRAEVSGGSLSWVTVSPDHGDAAGDYTITIGLGVNATGKDRRATVTIECGSTKITITVEQKGTTEEGEVPDEGDEPVVPAGVQLVSEVYCYFNDSPGVEDRRIELTYDERNRLVRWKETTNEVVSPGTVETVTQTYEYEYGDGVVRIANPEEDTHFTVWLNAAGYAERVERSRSGESADITTYEYDSENRLIRTEQEDEWEDYVWENGNLVESRYGSSDGESDVTRFTYTDLENRERPDFIGAWNELPSWYEELAWAGLLGVRNRNLMQGTRGDGEWSYKDDFCMEYEVDAEGYVTEAVEYGLTSEGETDRSNPRTYEVKHIASRK
ncbi:DUF4595 domain-containing protein [uncultured Alistipes sp.]|uniref:DUF4595 domain-containing protein n=1 Tax=uncultured Alistipes sp. TaxID=538949 RepID=UPI00265D277B|nr:DUF4595 domain-containing protein [uncultured Alistipes sp.]